MRTGGQARFFCVVKNLIELKEAVVFLKDNKVNFFVLGNGSNIIFPDIGFDGIVIKNEIKGKEIIKLDEDFGLLKCGAGEVWDDIVSFSLEQKMFGLENLIYIPGTVGASAVQNIGAYGAEAKDFIDTVEVFDTENLQTQIISNSECQFQYRDSIFKNKKNIIIISVTYKLSKKFIPNLKYSEIKKIFSNKTVDNFSEIDMKNAIIEMRRQKLPEVSELGSVGSFFKNPIVEKKEYQKLLENFPLLPKFDVDENHVKIPLGFVLDKICQLKGYRKGSVGLYDKQALVIVNYGGATSTDIINFANEIKEKVKEKVGLNIETEAEIIL